MLPEPQQNERTEHNIRKTTLSPSLLSAERRGMKEEPIFRPEGARDPRYKGRKKRSVPPFVGGKKVQTHF